MGVFSIQGVILPKYVVNASDFLVLSSGRAFTESKKSEN